MHALSLAGLPAEMTMLGIAIALGFVHIFLAAHFITAERGVSWNTGARDDTPPLKGKLAGRLYRAQENFKETFPFFAALILAVILMGRHNMLSVAGAELYVAARLLYLPLYAMGVPVLRTLVWLASIIGILALLACLFGA